MRHYACIQGLPQTSKMESFAKIVKPGISAKLSNLDVCRSPAYNSGHFDTCK